MTPTSNVSNIDDGKITIDGNSGISAGFEIILALAPMRKEVQKHKKLGAF